MQVSDFAVFRALMTGLGKVYEREIDEPLLDAYWLALELWSIEDFSAAAKHLMRCGRFFPRPSDFEDLRRSATQRDAVEAWETARRIARNAISLGRVRTDVTCGDPLIDRAVAAIGGYGTIALCDSAWMHALERRFLDAYSESRDVHDARAALAHLVPASTPLPAPKGKSATTLLTPVRGDAGPQRVIGREVTRTISGGDGGSAA